MSIKGSKNLSLPRNDKVSWEDMRSVNTKRCHSPRVAGSIPIDICPLICNL